MDQSELIKDYIKNLWKKEYPEQNPNYLLRIEWEEKLIPINEITCNLSPKNMKKAKKYAKLIKEGIFNFSPIICINNEIIDGYHRFWAYKQNNFQYVKIYVNIPEVY